MNLLRDYEWDPSLMFLVGVILLTAVMIRRFTIRVRRRQDRDAGYDTTASRKLLGRTTLIDAPPEILKWQVEMQEMARDLKAELDSKMRALQVLIQQAEQHEQRLAALLNQQRETITD